MRCRHSMPRFDYPPTRATWGARCGKSARRVLRGGTSTSDTVARPVPTHHHFAIDLKTNRLFATPEGYKAVLVFDVQIGKLIHTIRGTEKHHAILCVESLH